MRAEGCGGGCPRRELSPFSFPAERGGSPGQGCTGPAAGTRQIRSLSPRGWHGNLWSVFIVFLCSIIFLTQRPPAPGTERRRLWGDRSHLQQNRKNLERLIQGECVGWRS